MSIERTDEHRAKLEKLIAELRARIDAGDDEADPVELDQTRQGRLSRMDAMQRREMARETARRRGREMDRLEAALARVDEGEYGHCAACGGEIAPARLEVDPATPVCVDCAKG